MDVPYGGVIWCHDIISPFSTTAEEDINSSNFHSSNQEDAGLELEAKAWNFMQARRINHRFGRAGQTELWNCQVCHRWEAKSI